MQIARLGKLQEPDKSAAALPRVLWITTLLAGFLALVTGLFTLTSRPLLGVLVLIAAMAALLHSADGFCQGPGVFRSMKSRKQKEDLWQRIHRLK